jgi:hypothetical protein
VAEKDGEWEAVNTVVDVAEGLREVEWDPLYDVVHDVVKESEDDAVNVDLSCRDWPLMFCLVAVVLLLMLFVF